MVLRCIVADDEPLACRLITTYVERTEGLKLCGSFTSASQALDAICKDRPDIAFLDIQMPEMTGLDIARLIPETTRVIFTTAYRDYAVEGFRVNALDYLLKPVSYAEFLEAVGRARRSSCTMEDAFITVKSEYRLIRIKVRDIIYIEGLKDYIKIHSITEDKPVLTLMSMKSIESMLPEAYFMRVHRSFIANLSLIKGFEHGRLTYSNVSIPVSDSYRSTLMLRLQNNTH